MPYITAWLIAPHLKTVDNNGRNVEEFKAVDVPHLAQQIADQYNAWEDQGVEVVNTIPVVFGASEIALIDKNQRPADVASYSVTRGVILVGKS